MLHGKTLEHGIGQPSRQEADTRRVAGELPVSKRIHLEIGYFHRKFCLKSLIKVIYSTRVTESPYGRRPDSDNQNGPVFSLDFTRLKRNHCTMVKCPICNTKVPFSLQMHLHMHTLHGPTGRPE